MQSYLMVCLFSRRNLCITAAELGLPRFSESNTPTLEVGLGGVAVLAFSGVPSSMALPPHKRSGQRVIGPLSHLKQNVHPTSGRRETWASVCVCLKQSFCNRDGGSEMLQLTHSKMDHTNHRLGSGGKGAPNSCICL